MKRTSITMVGLCLLAVVSRAQTAPKPGPEHKKLDVFLGNWTYESEVQKSPMGPGGKVTGTIRGETLGGFYLSWRYEEKGPAGDVKGIELLGYDAARKTGTYSQFDSTGASSSGTWSASGLNWTFTGTAVSGAETIQQRWSVALAAGAQSFSYKAEVSKDGKAWTTMVEGKCSKAK